MSTVSYVARRVFPFACSLVLACNSEKLGPPLPDQDALFWDLKLNHHAVTLSMTAPYDTLQLVATPRNMDGAPLTGLPAVQYVSRDPERIRVTSGGRLVALSSTGATGQVVVVATLTVDNLTHKDSLFVRAVDNPNPPVLQALSVHPLPPDSAKVAAQRFLGTSSNPGIQAPKLPIRATDTAGTLIANPLVFFRSLEPNLILVHPITGQISFPLAGLSGDLKIVAEMTAFGIHKVDTLPYRIGLPIYTEYRFIGRDDGLPGNVPVEKELRIGKGAVVQFLIPTGGAPDFSRDIDIVFDDPTNVKAFLGSPISLGYALIPAFLCRAQLNTITTGSDCANDGNVLLRVGAVIAPGNPSNGTPAFSRGARTFPEAGVYNFHSELNGFRGRIVVVDESE